MSKEGGVKVFLLEQYARKMVFYRNNPFGEKLSPNPTEQIIYPYILVISGSSQTFKLSSPLHDEGDGTLPALSRQHMDSNRFPPW